GFHRLYGHRDVAVTGDEDDRNWIAFAAQLALEIEATHSRQSHVEDQTGRSIRVLAVQEILSCGECLYPKTDRLGERLRRLTHRPVIVNHEPHGIFGARGVCHTQPFLIRSACNGARAKTSASDRIARPLGPSMLGS